MVFSLILSQEFFNINIVSSTGKEATLLPLSIVRMILCITIYWYFAFNDLSVYNQIVCEKNMGK